MKFSAIHFASDYLRTIDELTDDFDFDLSTKRVAKLYKMKDKMLAEIFKIVKTHVLHGRHSG